MHDKYIDENTTESANETLAASVSSKGKAKFSPEAA